MTGEGEFKEESQAVKHYLLDFQDRLCQAFAAEDDGAAFRVDDWVRDAAGLPGHLRGGGSSRVLEQGAVIEKGGANFSHVLGERLPAAATAQRPELAGRSYEAMGVSVVIHPRNPYVPTSHANIRLFVATAPDQAPVWWFGGGFDLTPYYPFDEDILAWHRAARRLCEPFGPGVYAEYKAWCDKYFYLPHRGETRGVGGLFFDDLNQWGFDRGFAFLRAVGDGYLAAYRDLLRRRKSHPYGERERDFQQYRRGRYVEFNLVYDRGTLFGLQSGGRVESILMSMPPAAAWRYDWQAPAGSPEARLATYLRPRDWLGSDT